MTSIITYFIIEEHKVVVVIKIVLYSLLLKKIWLEVRFCYYFGVDFILKCREKQLKMYSLT